MGRTTCCRRTPSICQSLIGLMELELRGERTCSIMEKLDTTGIAYLAEIRPLIVLALSFLNTPDDTPPDSQSNGDLHMITLASQFMSNNPPEPFVIWLPTKGAHPTYGAPKGYYDM